ncbi:MAG: hypothetical protein Q7K57_40330 [Burkholderiaceae bacterium]|jgi:hypothetical protein|nr:hypothetical protein [Burkholderiaceae bacterium]
MNVTMITLGCAVQPGAAGSMRLLLRLEEKNKFKAHSGRCIPDAEDKTIL